MRRVRTALALGIGALLAGAAPAAAQACDPFGPAEGGASGDEAPWARELAWALQRGGVPVVMYRVP